jgi:hypothetical protein
MSIHLAVPTAPGVACCGAADAKRFTFWRWKATCQSCKTATAAVGFDQVREAAAVGIRSDVPIRFSALVALVRSQGMDEAHIAEFEREKTIAGSTCPKCKVSLPDPIVFLDAKAWRMVFACPHCSSPDVRARWEREGP